MAQSRQPFPDFADLAPAQKLVALAAVSQRDLRFGLIGMAAFLLCFVVFALAHAAITPVIPTWLQLGIVVSPAIPVILAGQRSVELQSRWIDLIRQEEWHGKETVAALLDAAGVIVNRSYPLRKSAHGSLAIVLPMLRESDSELLDASHRKRLYELLKSDDNVVYIPALVAVEAIGDDTALEYVEKFAAGKWGYLRPEEKKAAKQCLAVLETRFKKQSARQSLVQASSAPSNALPPTQGPAKNDAPEQMPQPGRSDAAPK